MDKQLFVKRYKEKKKLYGKLQQYRSVKLQKFDVKLSSRHGEEKPMTRDIPLRGGNLTNPYLKHL